MPNYREESKKKLSPFIEGLLPNYLKYEYDMFSATSTMSKFGRFIELFGEFLEKDNGARLTDFENYSLEYFQNRKLLSIEGQTGNPFFSLVNLRSSHDIDHAAEIFLPYLFNEYMTDFPLGSMVSSRRDTVKRIKEFYTVKGTPKAYTFFTLALFGKESFVSYPKDEMLIPSSSTWKSADGIRTTLVSGDNTTIADLKKFDGYYVVGEDSGAKAIVDKLVEYDVGSTRVYELLLEKNTQTGTFISNEIVQAQDSEGFEVLNDLSTVVRAQTQAGVGVTFTDKGTGYYLNDTITFSRSPAKGKIKKLGKGSLDDYKISTAGSGYAVDDRIVFINDYFETYGLNGVINVGDQIQGSKSGATAYVRAIDGDKYWIDTVYDGVETKNTAGEITLTGGKFKTDEVVNIGYGSEEFHKVGDTTKYFRARKLITICTCPAEAKIIAAGALTSSSIQIIDGGVDYSSPPKIYISTSTGSNGAIDFTGVGVGSIEEIEFINYGVSNVSADTVTFTAKSLPYIRATGTINLTTVVLHDDYNVGTIGLLNQTKIHDGDEFQEWSYRVGVNETSDKWVDLFKKNIHPSGLQMLPSYLSIDTESYDPASKNNRQFQTQTAGSLIVGGNYTITTFVSGDHFDNVGGTDITGSTFTATGTTPSTWTNSSLVTRNY